MSGFRAVWEGLDWSVLLFKILEIIPAIICITLHELSHGLVAYALGDDTAKKAGRLTLNPLVNLDWMGLLAMVIFHFGWAKPVPVNPGKMKNPKRGMALTALAGPVSNFLITVFFLILYGSLFDVLENRMSSAAGEILLSLIISTAEMSLMLGLFNLIPIPPLDGFKVVSSVLRDDLYWKIMRYERYGFLVLILLVRVVNITAPLDSVFVWVMNKLFVIAQFAYNLVN